MKIGLEGSLVVKWNSYVGKLVSKFIKLKEKENDTFCWSKNASTGEYITKLGYKTLMEAIVILR